ncbi:MAG: Asp23/Gls24 family envelope stress response protein [Clostridiales Family XIII bacterium]|jgi:uncharacterized alkaline shock family protein YloU|nr:Asp23/Gls24 family envelope stress response protein [Clostridiales Family XIII bacterium]
MDEKDNNELGTIKIAADVIVSYIGDAVLNTPGVVDFSGGLSDTISNTILGKDTKYKGVKIDENEGVYTVDVFVIAEYGVRIPEIAWNIQKNVKTKLEEIAALEIESVNIHIQGVQNRERSPDGEDDA